MKKLVMTAATVLTLCLPLASSAQSPGALPAADPASVGLSAEGLALATEALGAHIEGGDLAGVVAAVVRDGQLVYAEALGYRNMEEESPMAFDALFRTYSMTRPITALGIVMLHDEGVLDVLDPVQAYLPEFADQKVLSDPQSSDPSDTRPRAGEITLAQLLTHTSGIGSRNSQLYRAQNVHSWDQTLEEVVGNVARLPLFEEPGTRYRYGMHSEVLGRVIEVVSGMELEAFFEERIFRPLGMRDTTFFVDEGRRHRLATVYRPGDDGRLQPHQMEDIPVTERRALTSSGVGLVSTAMDFLRFSQFLLDDGVVDGEQLIGPGAIRMMAENAVPDELLPLGDRGYWAGSGWSLGGFAVVLDPSAYDHIVSPGEFWWDGSAGTRFWIDPQEQMITLVLAQVSPASGGGFRETFKTHVYEAIEEPR
jgi:CubicO group peptidase (beta-lactamase class C family)